MAFKHRLLPAKVRRVISLSNSFCVVTTNKCGHLVQFESEQERKLVLLVGHVGGLRGTSPDFRYLPGPTRLTILTDSREVVRLFYLVLKVQEAP